jgi:hypothetical protein
MEKKSCKEAKKKHRIGFAKKKILVAFLNSVIDKALRKAPYSLKIHTFENPMVRTGIMK